MTAERQWWGRVPGVLLRPVPVFRALREPGEDDLLARQEPILLVLLLAGMASVLLTPTWLTLHDPPSEIDGWLVTAIVTFIGGSLYGTVGYYVLGIALHLGAKGMGAEEPRRLARQVGAFAAVPLALSLVVVHPLRLAVFGLDIFRSGGSDAGTAGDLLLGLAYAALGWSLALLLVGVRAVYGFTWPRVAGTVFMGSVFVAAIAVLPSLL